MTHPRHRTEFDRYDATYQDAVATSMKGTGIDPDYPIAAKASILVDVVRQRWGDPARADALDFGCGIGLYETLLADRLGSLTGVDVSRDSVARAASANAAARYAAYDGRRLPFAARSFDVVFIITVLHHIPPSQWDSAMAGINRVLRPGGICVIFEHNPLNPVTRRIVSRCSFDADAVLLTAGRSRRLLRAANFADIQSRFIFSLPVARPWARDVDRALGRLPLGAQYYATARKPAS